MKLMRNSEVRKTLLVYGLVSAAAVAAAWHLSWEYGVLMLAVCLVFIGIYLVSTGKRYRHLTALAADIDRILHGNDPDLSLSRYAEGELCILQSEIQKMTVRLREQKQRLQDDKVYLADSIADISHQIRTPLTSINLILQFLREPNITESRKMELICQLKELLSRIDWLITTLLKISRLDAGTIQFKKEQVPLQQLLQTATEPLLVPIELREQNLVIRAEGDFLGDVSWTCEAIGNIVKNCMEHTPCGGEVRLTAVENALFSEIRIADTGCGIDPEDLPHIFERFYKGKNSDDKSFGVGLALAHTIVCKQNGILKAENGRKGGAVFTVRFYKGTI